MEDRAPYLAHRGVLAICDDLLPDDGDHALALRVLKFARTSNVVDRSLEDTLPYPRPNSGTILIHRTHRRKCVATAAFAAHRALADHEPSRVLVLAETSVQARCVREVLACRMGIYASDVRITCSSPPFNDLRGAQPEALIVMLAA